MILFDENTADDVWRKAALYLLSLDNLQLGRRGLTQELLHVDLTIQEPVQRWVSCRRPALNPAFAIAEAVWILRGRNDAAFLNYWNSKLPIYMGEGTSYSGAYGWRLTQQFGIDQVNRAFQALTHNPESRQVVLQIWDAKNDLPNEDGTPTAPDIPCNVSAILKIRNGALEWMQIMRSNDLFRGTPYNFIQFTILQEIMAGWLGVRVGTYTHIADSLHIYSDDLDKIHVSQEHAARNTDSLSLDKHTSDRAISNLEYYIEQLIRADLSRRHYEKMIESSRLPRPFHHLFLVLAAEAARRRKWMEVANDVIQQVDNPALTQVWHQWLARFHTAE